MYVELVVEGALGDLAASAFPELVIERRQILVTAESDALATLNQLADHNVDVVVLRRRPHPSDLD
jgi:hypothetical protein